ncbi:MAG: hypothetical protein H5T86_15635, partial [Armatimonadetes bacterium]|nr:hypothetical protein [Armatimonadota bacterium]
QMELRDYVRAILKRWVFVVLFTLTVTLAGGVYSLTVPAKFVAKARVIIRKPQASTLSLVAGAQAEEQQRGLSLNTYAKLLTSSENAKRVAQRLAARTSGQRIIIDPAEVVEALQAFPEEPDVIRVEASAPTPERAIAIANEAADSFVVLVGDFQRAEETAARQFLEDQLARTDSDISRLESEASRLRKQVGSAVVQIPAQAGQAGVQYVSLLQRYADQLAQTESEISALRSEIATVRGRLAGLKPYLAAREPVPNPTRAAVAQQLASYESALAEMLARYTPDHPAVVDLKERIAELRRQLEQIPATVEQVTVKEDTEYHQLRSRLAQLEAELSAAQGRRAQLNQFVAQLKSQAEKEAGLRLQTEAVQAQLSVLRQVKERLIADIQVRRMNEAIKGEWAAVLDRAVRAEAATPRLSRALLFACVLGLAVACALAIFFELVDDTIRDPDDLRRHTKLAYLGMVPRMEGLESPLVVLNAPKSPYAEAYRSIRAQINFRL